MLFPSSPLPVSKPKRAVYAAVAAIGVLVGGYAFHEHRTAQGLAIENQQTTAALNATRHELSDLTAKVNTLATRGEAPAEPSTGSTHTATKPRPAASRGQRGDTHFKKLQSQIDAQGKQIEQTRSELANTQGDLSNTRTELTGSIAHTHDELVLLQKKGERSYTEFDLSKLKEFRREGPLEVRLKKANTKHHFADLELLVDDRNLSQKHVNLFQPVMFFTPDSPQPVEVVINDVGKDHIHGYVSAPKYRQSELASMSNTAESTTSGSDQQATNSNDQPPPRRKLPTPQ